MNLPATRLPVRQVRAPSLGRSGPECSGLFHRRASVLSTFMLLAGLLASISAAPGISAQSSPKSPEISVTSLGADPTSRIFISGRGFTPAGLVYIVIHDQWGMVSPKTRWVSASRATHLPPQTLAAGEGFSFDVGGNIAEGFDIVVNVPETPRDSQNPALGPVTGMPTTMNGSGCGTPLLVSAFDRSSATWSNTVEVTLGCGG